MLANLGVAPDVKGRKDLRGRTLLLVDDETNPYRTMCFTVAAKIVKKRGAEVEVRTPEGGEVPHAKIIPAGAISGMAPRPRRPEPPKGRRGP